MSMKQWHKKWRKEFNDAVFKRDNYKCRICGKSAVDAHHITDRHDLPNGGYVLSNGISLCEPCHINAGPVGDKPPVHSPEYFYKMIGSSYEQAFKDSEALLLEVEHE